MCEVRDAFDVYEAERGVCRRFYPYELKKLVSYCALSQNDTDIPWCSLGRTRRSRRRSHSLDLGM